MSYIIHFITHPPPAVSIRPFLAPRICVKKPKLGERTSATGMALNRVSPNVTDGTPLSPAPPETKRKSKRICVLRSAVVHSNHKNTPSKTNAQVAAHIPPMNNTYTLAINVK